MCIRDRYRVLVEYVNADSPTGHKMRVVRSPRQVVLVAGHDEIEPGTVEYALAIAAQRKYPGIWRK